MPVPYSAVSSAAFVAAMFMFLLLPSANALETRIDQFVIFKNGSLFVNDKFDDGNPPPTSEAFFNNGSTPVTYMMRGVMTEGGSKAILDSADGFPTLGLSGAVLGEPVLLNRARVRTNIDPVSVSTAGLKIDDTIEVRGLFDLTVPLKKSDTYGIGLVDRATNIGNLGNDRVRIRVNKTPGGGNNRVSFVRSNAETGVTEVAGQMPLDATRALILLILTRSGNSAADREVQAKFAYLDAPIDISGDLSALTFEQLDNVIVSSNPGGSPNIGSPITIFNGEEYTRAQFRVRVRDDLALARLETDGPASISRLVDTPNGDYSVTLDYRFESTSGELTVNLDGTPIAVVPAPATLDENFTPLVIDVTDPALQNLSGAELKITIDDPNPGAVVLIDNVNFPGLPNENFADGTLSNWATEGNAGVLVVESAEDAEVEIDRAKLAKFKGKSTFQIKGTLIFDSENSDGFNLPEDVRVTVGGYTQDIPADAFHIIRKRLFHFSKYFRKRGGGEVRAAIFWGWGPGINYLELKPDGRFNIWATKVDLGNTNVDEPVPFSLRVGNDLGQSDVEFERFFRLSFSSN
ncbi:MAG: hypothetical protein OEO83_08580 [Alphaproteobacteria bacterium]|nr:hypothetical protein [Alphaproteobacteria bacterium]